MKTVVESHSGPCMMAFTTRAIQLSPSLMENRLCWLFTSLGSTTEKFGRVPACASRMTWREGTMLCRWCVLMQSANVGQMAQPYGTRVDPEAPGFVLAYSFQDSPARPRRSMIVGTWRPGGWGRKVPDPSAN